MRFFTLKRTRTRVHHTQRYPLYAALIALVAAIVVLAVFAVKSTRFEERLLRNRAELADQARSEISVAMRAYDRIALPGMDLANDLIPTMDEHLYTADRLSAVITLTHGEEYGVIDHQLYLQIDSALADVRKHLSGGTSTDAALAVLDGLIQKMQTDIRARYGETTMLPQTSIQ